MTEATTSNNFIKHDCLSYMNIPKNVRFRYREVHFGTRFKRKEGIRFKLNEGNHDDPDLAGDCLYDNEIACDVGGRHLGIDDESLNVIDHHFECEHQFPSATAAILHQLPLLAEQFKIPEAGSTIWLVHHKEPDFDAYASLYLVRQWLSGNLTLEMLKGANLSTKNACFYRKESKDKERAGAMDWIGLKRVKLPLRDEGLWAFLLAAYASCVDQARRLEVPRHRSLHAVLYAAILRGRNFKENGATPLFDFIVEQLSDPEKELNPLCDDIFLHSKCFSPELDLLERQELNYARDMKRARRSLVYLPSGSQFDDWFPEVKKEHLFEKAADGNKYDRDRLNPKHTAFDRRELYDGLYLRDPECLLFKEYVRQDIENSSLGKGFTFTAIAYSQGKPGNPRNTTDYYFSLDPETAGSAHLYPVWARLQQAEEKTSSATDTSKKPRGDFEERLEGLNTCADPWFDGQGFNSTIVVTPSSGTQIKGGKLADLSDDCVTNIVKSEVENFFADTQVQYWDFVSQFGSSEPDCNKRYQVESNEGKLCALSDLVEHSLPRGSLRFAQIRLRRLHEDSGHFSKSLSYAVGEKLWKALEKPGIETLPADFAERHLLFDEDTVAVWNRNGIAIAYKDKKNNDNAKNFCDLVRKTLEDVSGISYRLDSKLKNRFFEGADMSEDLLKLVEIRHRATSSEGRVLRRFLDAMRFDSLLGSLHAQKQEEADSREAKHERQLTKLAAVFIFPSLLLAFFDAVSDLRLIDFPRFWALVRQEGVLSVDWSAWPAISVASFLSLAAALVYLKIISPESETKD